MPEGFDAFQDLVPEGEVPYMSIRVVATFDERGEPMWHAALGGDVRVGALLGQLELVKHWLLTEAKFD